MAMTVSPFFASKRSSQIKSRASTDTFLASVFLDVCASEMRPSIFVAYSVGRVIWLSDASLSLMSTSRSSS